MSARENKNRRLRLTDAALKFLKNLQPKQCKQVALTILGLSQNATPHDSRDFVGHAPWRRVDIDEYRIIYRFDDDTVYVPEVGKRNDDEIYRWLKR